MTQTKPTIELKNIKVAAFASEETHCYEASLYVDGVRWGVVSNDGHGGPDNFHGEGRNYNDITALNERIGATYPEMDLTSVGCPGETMKECLETICGGLVNDFLMMKEAKKLVTKKVSFVAGPIVKGADIRFFPLKVPAHETKIREIIATKYPGATILNDMDPVALVTALRTVEG